MKKGNVVVVGSFLMIAIVMVSIVFGSIIYSGYSKIVHPINAGQDEGPDSPEIPSSGGGSGTNDPGDVVANPVDAGELESQFYSEYIAQYLGTDGRVISNHKAVSWGGDCIGKDDEITSEAVARMMRVAVLIGDKEVFDKLVQFSYSALLHPDSGHMMWKLDPDLSSGSCGGANSAVDSELIAIESLNIADATFGSEDSQGRAYKDTAKLLADALKPGLIDGTIIPFCMYPQGDETRACTRKSFLGYSNLPALKEMCVVDTQWCPVYAKMKAIQIASVQNGGIYSAYEVDSQTYLWENADIHPNWNIRHLAFDGGSDTWNAVEPFYDETRTIFMNNREQGRGEICQEFQPGVGCKEGNPSERVYAHWLEIASYRCEKTNSASDCDFRDELVEFLVMKNKQHPEFPLVAKDHYGNVAVLEAYAIARNSGGIIQ